MGNSDSSSGGMNSSSRHAVRRLQYSKILRNPHWIRPLRNNSEAGDTSFWSYTFKNPQPAFVVNPQYGMCLIWSRETNIHPVTKQRRQFYLVTFVRAVKKIKKAPKSLDTKKRKRLVLRPDKFYKVPATITMFDGVEVEYIIPLRFVISNIYNGDSSDASVVILDVRSREKIDRMTLEEFQKVMKAKPPQPNTRGYLEAFSALYATSPEYVALHLLSSEVVVSKDAEPFMISTTSRTFVEDEPAPLNEPIEKIGSFFGLFPSQEEMPRIQYQEDTDLRRMFHPQWYRQDQDLVQEFDSLFDKKEMHSSVIRAAESFDEHDGIVASSSQRVPGREIFKAPGQVPLSRISEYNNYIQ